MEAALAVEENLDAGEDQVAEAICHGYSLVLHLNQREIRHQKIVGPV